MNQILPKPSDRWIPYYFVIFFVVIAILDAIFVTLAISSHRGVVTDNAYQKGLDYNKTVSAADRQTALAWSSEIDLTKTLLSVNLADSGKPLSGAKVNAYFSRPTQAGFDFMVTLDEINTGVYQQKITLPLLGVWDVRLLLLKEQQHFQTSQRFVVK